jgi:hypothetical protein
MFMDHGQLRKHQKRTVKKLSNGEHRLYVKHLRGYIWCLRMVRYFSKLAKTQFY